MPSQVYTYSYSSVYHPPMPVVEIGLSLPGRPESEVTHLALLDSGSDGTLVPLEILESLGARYVDQVRLRTMLDGVEWVDRYMINLRIGLHHLTGVRAVAMESEQEIIS